MPILKEKQESDSTSHITNAVRGGLSPIYVGCSSRCSCHLFTYYGELVVEWFAKRNSF